MAVGLCAAIRSRQFVTSQLNMAASFQRRRTALNHNIEFHHASRFAN